MKKHFPFWLASALVLGVSLVAVAQPHPGGKRPRPPRHSQMRPIQNPAPPAFKTLRGEAYFLERIALPPNAQLHVFLVGRVAGADYLPLGTTVLAAKNGVTPFEIFLPLQLPPAPYRLQAWIIADNRVWMVGRDAQTVVDSVDVTTKIRLKVASAPQNIDGIGDGKPLAAIAEGVSTFAVAGEVQKLDRRALLPDAVVEIILSDVSRADAPEKVLASVKRELKGEQLPLAFEFGVDKTQLLPNRRYNLRARITEGGKLSYITESAIAVTPQNVGQKWNLQVKSAR